MNDPTFELGRFPAKLGARIQSELASDERIVLVGRPGVRRYLVQSIPVLILALPFIVIPGMMIALGAGLKIPGVGLGENQSGWFGVPFLFVGLALLYVPFWGRRIAHRTAYVVTDRRAIIFDGVRPGTVYTFLPNRLRDLKRTERRDGSGDLIFLRPAAGDSPGEQFPTELGFQAIPNVKQVEELVRRLVDERAREKT